MEYWNNENSLGKFVPITNVKRLQLAKGTEDQ